MALPSFTFVQVTFSTYIALSLERSVPVQSPILSLLVRLMSDGKRVRGVDKARRSERYEGRGGAK